MSDQLRKCGHPLGSTSWCPDCVLAEARRSGEFRPQFPSSPTPTTPKLPEPATGAMKVVAWWVEAIGLGQREKPHPSYNPEPLVRLSDAQALAGEVERLRAALSALLLALEKEMSPEWECKSYHPTLVQASLDASRALATQEAKA